MVVSLLLDIIAPLLVLVGLGAVMRRKFKIQVDTLSKLNMFLFTPAFIFDRVVRSELKSSDMFGIVAVTTLLIAILGFGVWAVGRVQKVERRTLAALAMAAMFYNSGNYGLPLAELAYPAAASVAAEPDIAAAPESATTVDTGHVVTTQPIVLVKDGAAPQTFVVLTLNVLTFTLGLSIAAGADSKGPMAIARKMLSLPVLYTLTAALIGRHFFGPDAAYEMPKLLAAVTRYLGNALVPVSLVTLGAQLAVSARWPVWRYIHFAIVTRLLIGPAIMTGLLYLFHTQLPGSWLDLWPWPAELLILTAGVPSAINTLLLVLELDGDPDLTADCVFWTTVASAGTMTAWLAVLRLTF